MDFFSDDSFNGPTGKENSSYRGARSHVRVRLGLVAYQEKAADVTGSPVAVGGGGDISWSHGLVGEEPLLSGQKGIFPRRAFFRRPA